jgi:hypothetical protein
MLRHPKPWAELYLHICVLHLTKVMVIYKGVRPGLGLSPSPDAPHITFQTNLNIIQHINHIRTTMWANGSPHSTKSFPKGEVTGSNPVDYTILINKPKPIKGCHVAAHDWATWHHNICQEIATCRQLI